MFYQVQVTEKDRDLLRFLWWPEGDLKQRTPEPLAAEAQKFRGDGRVVFARAPGLRKYKVALATPKKADERGGGGGLPPKWDNFWTSFTLLGRDTLSTQHRPPG